MSRLRDTNIARLAKFGLRITLGIPSGSNSDANKQLLSNVEVPVSYSKNDSFYDQRLYSVFSSTSLP